MAFVTKVIAHLQAGGDADNSFIVKTAIGDRWTEFAL
jgi:hypothetical protein